ncbi:hypothetical protein YC2023_025625 [Brassica napus]
MKSCFEVSLCLTGTFICTVQDPQLVTGQYEILSPSGSYIRGEHSGLSVCLSMLELGFIMGWFIMGFQLKTNWLLVD